MDDVVEGFEDGPHLHPMARGFVYLAVALDWASCRVLSWLLSITLEAPSCAEALQEVLARHGNARRRATSQTVAPFAWLSATSAIKLAGMNARLSRDR